MKLLLFVIAGVLLSLHLAESAPKRRVQHDESEPFELGITWNSWDALEKQIVDQRDQVRFGLPRERSLTKRGLLDLFYGPATPIDCSQPQVRIMRFIECRLICH